MEHPVLLACVIVIVLVLLGIAYVVRSGLSEMGTIAASIKKVPPSAWTAALSLPPPEFSLQVSPRARPQ